MNPTERQDVEQAKLDRRSADGVPGTCQCAWVGRGGHHTPCPCQATGEDGVCDTCRAEHSDGSPRADS